MGEVVVGLADVCVCMYAHAGLLVLGVNVCICSCVYAHLHGNTYMCNVVVECGKGRG